MANKPKPPKIEIPAATMAKVGKKERKLIEMDARKGIDQSPHSASTGGYSEAYKKYKAGYMRRRTNRTGSKGTLLKGMEGSVRSNQTAFKNYTLTETMWRRFHNKNPKVNEITVEYDQADKGKIMGADDNGDQLVGLNNANVNTIRIMLIKYINKQLGKWAKDDLNLTIG